MTKRKAIINTTLFTIFATVMTILVIVIVATQIWPLIRFGPFSPCWGVFVSDINSFSIWPWEKEKSVDFHLCDVVGVLAFVNKDELEGFEKNIGEKYSKVTGCEEGYEGYVVGVPQFREIESGLKFWLWPKDAFEEVKRLWKEKMGGIKPECKGLDKPFVSKPDPIKGPETGSAIWCVTFSLEKEGYVVSAKEGKCK